MTIPELKVFFDKELENAEIKHQDTLKRHNEIMKMVDMANTKNTKVDIKEEILIKTNIGHIPSNDYKEIMAMQYGFDSYEDLLAEGYYLD